MVYTGNPETYLGRNRRITSVKVTAADDGLRWRWPTQEEGRRPPGRRTYVLIPGQQSGPFRPGEEVDAASVAHLGLFIVIQPETAAGSVLRKAELAR